MLFNASERRLNATANCMGRKELVTKVMRKLPKCVREDLAKKIWRQEAEAHIRAVSAHRAINRQAAWGAQQGYLGQCGKAPTEVAQQIPAWPPRWM